ncbi:SPFH domain-containing protein [Streptomyces sp. NPDC056485]|uniref:SPFH domain-containing protein n=1 Tax=Streptomyces sp. NPDC056485 TaxID=3345834 RepID=UPI0036C48E23
MYPTRTTSTTGTFRIPPAPPQAAAVRATGDLYAPALRPQPAQAPLAHPAQGDPNPQAWSASPAKRDPEAAPAIDPPPHADGPEAPPPYGIQTGPTAEPVAEAPDPVVRSGAEAGMTADIRAANPLPHTARIPGPFEAPADSRAVTEEAPRSGSDAGASAGAAVPAPDTARGAAESEVPARALGTVVGGPGAAAPGADAGDPVPAAAVALPHGRPAVESAWSEVPAARIRVEPEPVHALARAGERAEPCGSPYGHEPEPLGSVPAPAAHPHAHSGVPTLRLRAEPAPPAVPATQPHAEAGSDAAPGAEAGPREPYVRAGLPAGFHAQSAADGSGNRHGDAGLPEPSAPQPRPQSVQGGFRARPGQVWPLAGPGADGPAQRYGEPWPPAAPEGAPATRAPHAPPAPYVPQPHDGAEAESEHRPGVVPGPAAQDVVTQDAAAGDAVARDVVARCVEPRTDEGDAEEPPQVAPGRGAAATEVPAHLPFAAESRPAGAPATRAGHRAAQAPAPARAVRPSPSPSPGPGPGRAEPGRRVPRGDERLREHRGPVLPGWVGVGVGALALTGCLAVLWRAGAVPAPFVAAFGAAPRAYQGLQATHWPPLAFLGIVALLALGGLGRAKAGHAWVLTLFGRYRGTVRRTGLTWVSPLLLRRRVDVRLRHWRSEPMPAVDSGGLALRVVVQVVWQVKDTARATLAVEDHTEYLAEQVESAMARVLSQLPADAFHEDAPTLRDSEAVGDALTRMLASETEAVGIEVYSAQPTRIEYAPEVAEAMRRRRVAAIDAKHRDTVLTSVVDAVDDTVHRLTSRGLVELDDYERKALVKDLTVAFYTGRPE